MDLPGIGFDRGSHNRAAAALRAGRPDLEGRRVTRLAAGQLPYRRACARGFTLPELIVVIVIAGILVLVAYPSLNATVQSNRVDTAANQFIATLSMARSEAVKYGCNVDVLAASNGNNWGAQGWQVIPEAANCPASVPTAQALQNVPALTGSLTAYGSASRLTFSSTGQLINTVNAAGVPEFDFIFCADGVTATFPVAQGGTVVMFGRVRLADHPNGTPLENDELTAMTCQAP
jgi:type IV fimbrial biogenesis protein FimT